MPLHYGYELVDGKLTFYMHGAKQGHKLDLIKKNPHVFVELECDVSQISGGDVPCKYGSSFASVMGRGNAEIVEDVSLKIQGLKALMQNQTGKDFEITEKMTKIVSVIKVTMSDFTAKKEADRNFIEALEALHFTRNRLGNLKAEQGRPVTDFVRHFYFAAWKILLAKSMHPLLKRCTKAGITVKTSIFEICP